MGSLAAALFESTKPESRRLGLALKELARVLNRCSRQNIGCLPPRHVSASKRKQAKGLKQLHEYHMTSSLRTNYKHLTTVVCCTMYEDKDKNQTSNLLRLSTFLWKRHKQGRLHFFLLHFLQRRSSDTAKILNKQRWRLSGSQVPL